MQTVRAMGRSRWTYLAIVASLATGVGICVVMAGALDELLLRSPQGLADAQQLRRVVVATSSPNMPTTYSGLLNYRDYAAITRESRQFRDAAAYLIRFAGMGQGEAAREIREAITTANYFTVLGAQPARGRFYQPADVDAGAAVAVVSHRLQADAAARGEEILGRTLLVGGQPVTVVGVAPDRFTGADLDEIDIWLPLEVRAPAAVGVEWRTSGGAWLRVFGRVPRAGPGNAPIGDELTRVLAAAHAGELSSALSERVVLADLVAARGPEGESKHAIPVWLAIMSGLVLLVAWSNAGSLLLLMATQRSSETGIRVALGATSRHLVQRVLAEGVVLGIASGLTATGVAVALRTLLLRLAPSAAYALRADLNARTLFVLIVVNTLLVAAALLTPMLLVLRSDPKRLIGGGVAAPARGQMRRVLVGMQIALLVPLLFGAYLLSHSMGRLVERQRGLDTDRVIVAEVNLAQLELPDSAKLTLYAEMRAAMAGVPGITHASLAENLPFASASGVAFYADDDTKSFRQDVAYVNHVAANYFTTVGTPMVRGRAFRDDDKRGSRAVVIINEALARRYWRENLVGQCVWLGSPDGDCAEVVGIARNTVRLGITEAPQPQVFVPLRQRQLNIQRLVLLGRVDASDPTVIPALRQAIQSVRAGMPYAKVRRLRDVVEPQLAPWRLGATLFRLFAAAAALLAVGGLYALMAHLVSLRRKEIAIRMAVGATGRSVVMLVGAMALRLTLVGSAIGLAIALVGARWIEAMLFETPIYTLAGISLALLGPLVIAILASVRPSTVAARTEPVRLLGVDGA